MFKTNRDRWAGLLLVVLLLATGVLWISRSRPKLLGTSNPIYYLIWGTAKPSPAPAGADRRMLFRKYRDNAEGGYRVVALSPWEIGTDLRNQQFPPDTSTLEFENDNYACSETCYHNEFGTNPSGLERRWDAADLALLSRLTKLRHLRFANVWLGKGALKAIADCQNLSSLALDRCDFDDSELPQLRRLQKLRILRFYDTYFHEYLPKPWIKPDWIRDLKSLTELQLVGVTDAHVLDIARLVPADCVVVLPKGQYDKLVTDSKRPGEIIPRLGSRSEAEMKVYTGY